MLETDAELLLVERLSRVKNNITIASTARVRRSVRQRYSAGIVRYRLIGGADGPPYFRALTEAKQEATVELRVLGLAVLAVAVNAQIGKADEIVEPPCCSGRLELDLAVPIISNGNACVRIRLRATALG